MIDSPCHAHDQTKFAITEAGVQDVQERVGEGSSLVAELRLIV